MSGMPSSAFFLARGGQRSRMRDEDGNEEEKETAIREFHSTDGVHRLILPGANR